MQKGVALGWVLSNDGRQVLVGDTDIAALAEAAVKVVRMELRLGSRPEWDRDLLGRYAGVADRFAKAGIGVLGLLSHEIVPGARQDQWNEGSAELGGGTTSGNAFIDQYRRAAEQVVAGLPAISKWEIWNEPNAWKKHEGQAYSGGSFIYPSLYAQLLSGAIPVIKEAQPRSAVVSGGILAHNVHGVLSSENSGATYMRQVLAGLSDANEPAAVDALGLHLYVDQAGAAAGDHIQRYLDEHAALPSRALHAGRSLPIYVTEVGWDTRAVSPEQQAANATMLLHVCSQHPSVAVVCWFSLRDNPAAALHFGLCTADGARKPAFDAFARSS